jgi:small conductance mechanosensitive channel
VDFVFGIGYDDDIDKARQVIERIINEDERVLKDPAPMVAVSELGDSSVNFTARAWTSAGDYWSFYFDTTEKVKKQFDAEGISIPFPQRDVHVYEHKE